MIYLERRDGRKELGIGFVGRGGAMDDTELEEGEACDYRVNNDIIDPDVDLSYLDEKVQDLLGHLQKDFEGGVSAENLGSKFGGYGSFLPTYQRSPSVLSHPKTPQKVQSYGTPKSPRSFPSEGACQNSAVLSSVTPFVKVGPASTSTVPAPVSRAPFVENSSKRDRYPSLISSEEPTIKHEPINKAITSSDQKSLKVRIKVGSDNISNKTAEIFSGLGLDSSPFSSPEDSPVESGGLSPKFRESPDKSPTSILQIMTCFPVPDEVLLSPLPDSMLCLKEKHQPLRDNRSLLDCKGSQDSFSMLVEDSSSVIGEGRIFGGKRMKSLESRGKSVEAKNRDVKDGSDINALLKKEIDIETAEGRELVSDSLKLPLLYDSNSTLGNHAKDFGRTGASSEVRKGRANENFVSSDYIKEEMFDSSSGQGARRAEKLKMTTSSEDKVWVDRKESPRKDGMTKCNKSYDPIKSDVDGSKGRRDLNSGTIDPPKNKVYMKATHDEQAQAKASYGNDKYVGKKKSKGSKSKGSLTAELPKERLTFISSSASRDKKKSSSDSSSKIKFDDNKSCRDSDKVRGSHRDFSGDVKMEQAECSLEFPSKDRPKHKLEVTERQTHQFADKSKERLMSKKNDTQLTSAAYSKGAPTVVLPAGNGPASDAATAAPVLIEENWVACDKCQKWRLLPYGTNPDHLPKKWLCHMLNWLPLPGMNRCTVSEEETTKALQAMYIPVPVDPSTQHAQQNGVESGVILLDVQHTDMTHQDPNLNGVPSGGKKKHGLKETSNTSGYPASKHLSNSKKKNQYSSTKSRSLNDVNQSPLQYNHANNVDVQHVSRSNDSARKGEQKMTLDRGNANLTKMNIKREADQDGYRASKKSRNGGLSYDESEWNSDTGGIMGKTTINGLSATAAGKGVQNYVDSSSKDQNCDAEKKLLVSAKKPKDLVKVSLDERAIDVAKVDKREIATKKRKVKEWQENRIYLPDTANLERNADSFREGTSESEHKKEKKQRISKSHVKESRKSNGSDTTEKRDQATRILISSSRDLVADGMENDPGYTQKDQRQGKNRGRNIMSQQMLDSVESLKRDSLYAQPSLAATSSSSKVSGSRKSKGNFQETKGSPVESVSSSPLRIANPDKCTSARRILMGKDDATNAVFSVMGSPRRCSDVEGDGGSDRSGRVRKVKASSAVNRGSLESSVLDYSDRDTAIYGKPSQNEPSSCQLESPHLVSDGADALDQYNEYGEIRVKQHTVDGERRSNHNIAHGSPSWKSAKGYSSKSKDKHRSSVADLGKGGAKVYDPSNEQEDFSRTKNSRSEMNIESQDNLHPQIEQRDGVGKHDFQENYGDGVQSGKDDKSYSSKKDSTGRWSSESRVPNRSNSGVHTVSDSKAGTSSKDGKSYLQDNLVQDRVSERSSHRSLSDRTDQLDMAPARGKSKLFSHFGDKPENQTRCPLPMPVTQKGSGSDVLPVVNSGGSDGLKITKLPRKPDNKAGAHHNSSRHKTSNGLFGDLDGPSPVRKDSSSQVGANNALKEAKDLKHSADRLKNAGSVEATGIYFQAALKFLHGASLLEQTCSIESSKHGETQSTNVYSSTASLCEFVAHEYERCKEMAAAALAYKCMEVAYMRVIYLKHSSANKDRHELQAALQMVPPGESPSSSASDVDNLNNQGTLEKAALTKGVGSPHVGNHIIAARNRQNFERLLNFAQEVNFAMEASRKSLNAFAVGSANLDKSQCDHVSSVIDCNFYDVQGLLQLVRFAIEAINR